MGICVSRRGKAEEKLQAIEIDEELRKYRRKLQREVNLLLLGAGDSGKSTFVKQLKIIHLEGFTLSERKDYTYAVFGNVITSLQCLIRAAIGFGYTLQDSKAVEELLELSSYEPSPEIRNTILKLYQDKSLKKTEKKVNEIYLPDSATYFFENLSRIMEPDYIPTAEDIIRTRIKTMGINELVFNVGGNTFRLVDVGGQRSERRKWIHCFQGVSAIIFCVALSEYNLALEEDPTVNRMHESLQLFNEICNSGWFRNVALILFLNKADLFRNKISHISLQVCFPEYKGSNDYDEAVKFIQNKFLSIDVSGQKPIYPHVTVATDTENVSFVFEAVKDTIIQGAIYDVAQSSI